MKRSSRALLVGSLLGCGLAVSCVVSNVELVDSLPGASDGGAGVAGTATSPSGGDDSTAGGGDDGPSNGGKNSGGSGAGRAGNGPSPGGSGGSSGSGGSGSGGYTTDPTEWTFGDKGACDTDAPAMFCDDFEAENPVWTGGLPGSRPMVADAPSGNHIWETSFTSAAMNVIPSADGFNVSFWVRLAAGGDHTFIDWSGPGQTTLSFGVEGGAYRFRLASDPMAYSAPELLKYTRNVRFDTWTCVELAYVDATFQATVTVLGEAPVKLAVVGGTADAGIDEKVLTLGDSGAFDIGPSWGLGETGANIEFDDVRVVPLGQPSVCQDFIAANNP